MTEEKIESVMSKQEVKDFVRYNKDSLQTLVKDLKGYYEDIEVSPMHQFLDKIKKDFGIKDLDSEGFDFSLGDTTVYYECIRDLSVCDCENFIDFGSMDYEDSLVFKEVEVIGSPEGGFIFDEEYFEKNKQYVDNSMKLQTYAAIMSNIYKDNDKFDDDLFSELDFIPEIGINNYDYDCEIYKHKYSNVYIKIPFIWCGKHEIIVTNNAINEGFNKDMHIDIAIEVEE